MSAKQDLLYKDGPDTATHQVVHARFLELLARDRDAGLSIPWKKALLEPPNPLEPKKRPGLKLPVLLGLWILSIGVTIFVWFSFLQ